MSSQIDFILGMGYAEAAMKPVPKFICPFCEESIKPDDIICPNCGKELPRCPRCNKALPDYAYEIDECPLCGKELWK
jgi:predicted amidophosphoribosyltransferase